MPEEMKKTGTAFWILIIVGMKSSFLTLSSLNDVQSDDQILLRGLALISATSAFIAARLLWTHNPKVKFIAAAPFLALVGFLVALAFVDGENVTPGMSIVGCFVIVFIGAIALVKIYNHFGERKDEFAE